MAQMLIIAVIAGVSAAETIHRLLQRPRAPFPMQDLQVSSSADGSSIVFGYGANRFAGQIIWCPGILTSTIQSGGSGGSSTNYLYGANFAAAFGEGPGIIRRIWGDTKLIYLAPGTSQAMSQIGTYADWNPATKYIAGDIVYVPAYFGTLTATIWECVIPNLNQMPAPLSLYWVASTQAASWINNVTYNPGDLVFYFRQEYASITPNNQGNEPDVSPANWTPLSNYWKKPTLYTGTEAQTPDPLIQGIEGAGFTPAFRPLIYAVWDKFPLANFGNRIPNIRAEIFFNKTSNLL